MSRFLPLVLAACALIAGCGGPDLDDPIILPEERELGAEQHPLLLAEFGGRYDAPEAAYARALGERIAGTAGLEGQCTFTLVNSDVVNAFAVPGCYIYVTRGMMSIVNSEAELGAVLAHEVGHIVAAHGRRQQSRSFWRTLGVLAVGLVTGSEQLTRMAGRAAEYFTLRYSRTQEYQADDLGIRYLAALGYDPYAVQDMLAALGRHERFLVSTRGRDEARSIPEWARTHPNTENRVERAGEKARETGIAPESLPEGEAAYLREVDGLLYGDDPAQGFVIGRRFAHPLLRIGFTAPEGFTLTNSPQAIFIEGPDGLRGQFGIGRLPPQGLEAYAAAIADQLLRGAPARIGKAERLIVNGLPALILPAVIETEQGAVELNIAVYEGPGSAAYHFILAAPPADSLRTSIASLFASFHLLSPEQIRSLRPRVIQTVAVTPRDSIASLARLMASEHPVDHFLMLNALAPGAAPAPGQLVKIVTFASR
ncbi:MAG TPA: M48 family metalloprotease [Allosphingosinicella sp.]|nr:M48 family metalloprotease [Allosphingosinicella sp.]